MTPDKKKKNRLLGRFFIYGNMLKRKKMGWEKGLQKAFFIQSYMLEQ